MTPEFSDAPFIVATAPDGRQLIRPKDSFGGDFRVPGVVRDELGEGAEIRTVRRRWFARWHEPGYLEATDWIGPYGSQGEAEAALLAEGPPKK